MKKGITLLLAITFAITTFAQTQTTRDFTWDATLRSYIEITPTDQTQPKPVVFILHGLGDTMEDMVNVINENAPDWYYIVPQGLVWSVDIPTMGTQDVGPAWNCGVTVNAGLFGNYPINPDVDDPGFFMAVLDSLITHYNIDENQIFFTGFSLGGFMANKMAKLHSDKINAIASVSGTIGNNMTNITPTDNINVLHIHGTNDAMINYNNGNITLEGLPMPFQVGIGAEPTVNYWKNFNHTDAQAVIYNYPNLEDDGLTFERYSYLNGNNNSRVVFIKVNEGEHDWYSRPGNDIDYFDEIIKFFQNQMDTDYPAEYTISGTVKVGNNPLADVLITYNGNTTTTDSEGNYSFTAFENTNLTITPSKEDYAFTPDFAAFIVTRDTTISFVATSTIPVYYTVRGTVTIDDNMLSGVTISYLETSTTTNQNGEYSFQVLENSLVRITPSFEGYEFTPAFKELTVTMDTIVNFSATEIGINGYQLSKVNVYPNPTNSAFRISGVESANIEIYDLTGKLLYETKNINYNTEIDIANLQNGVYFVKINDNNNIKTLKIILEK